MNQSHRAPIKLAMTDGVFAWRPPRKPSGSCDGRGRLHVHQDSSVRVDLLPRKRLSARSVGEVFGTVPDPCCVAENILHRQDHESLLTTAIGLAAYIGAMAFVGWALFSRVAEVLPSVQALLPQ